MPPTEDQVMDALKAVKYPGFSRDIVSFGLVKGIDLKDGDVLVQLALATNDPAVPQTIKNEAEASLGKLPGIRSAKVRIDIQAPPAGSGNAGV
nr:iron-sulfur cluster assembly protein [Chthoniobacterales bacterium]